MGHSIISRRQGGARMSHAVPASKGCLHRSIHASNPQSLPTLSHVGDHPASLCIDTDIVKVSRRFPPNSFVRVAYVLLADVRSSPTNSSVNHAEWKNEPKLGTTMYCTKDVCEGMDSPANLPSRRQGPAWPFVWPLFASLPVQ